MLKYVFMVMIIAINCAVAYSKDNTPKNFVQAEMALLQNIAYQLNNIKKKSANDTDNDFVTKEMIIAHQRDLRTKIREELHCLEYHPDDRINELAIVLRKLYFALGTQKSKIVKLDSIDQVHLLYLFNLIWITQTVVNQFQKNIYDNEIISDQIVYLIEKIVAAIESDTIN